MSEHNHECGCGDSCGCGGHNHDELESMFITLTTEEGEDIKCEVVAMFPFEEKQYAAVTPVEDPEELILFRVEPDDEDEEEGILVDIEDEEELERVIEAFQELLDEQEWDELTEDEE